MNFATTNELLETLKPYTENANITVSCENTDWKGQNYKSDFVTINEENNLGFEVFDNEIIVFYFTDHYHFEDYSSESEYGENNYIKRAKDFLKKLFENQIKHIEMFKGKKLATEKYYIIYSDNKEEYIGGTCWRLMRLFNPFLKKKEKETIYKFSKEKGCFLKR